MAVSFFKQCNYILFADSRNGSKGEAGGNGTQSILSGTGEEIVRLRFTVDPQKVLIIAGHQNWFVAAMPILLCYRIKEFSGWQQVFTRSYLDWTTE